MINEIPEEMMPEMFVVPITVPPVTYAKVIIQGDNVTIEPRLKTNADRIRAMTGEELAGFLLRKEHHCPGESTSTDCVEHETCEECWLDWLKQEAME